MASGHMPEDDSEMLSVLTGRIGAHMSHLICGAKHEKGFVVSPRVGKRCGNSIIAGESHCASRVVWVNDLAAPWSIVSNAYKVQTHFDETITYHGGGNAMLHYVLYTKDLLYVTMPDLVREQLFVERRGSTSLELLVTGRKKQVIGCAEIDGGITVKMTGIEADLLREVVRILRRCRNGVRNNWVSGYASRIPFCGPWTSVIRESTTDFGKYLLKYYVCLLRNVAPAMVCLKNLDIETRRSSVRIGSEHGYISDTDCIQAACLYYDMVGGAAFTMGSGYSQFEHIVEPNEYTIMLNGSIIAE